MSQAQRRGSSSQPPAPEVAIERCRRRRCFRLAGFESCLPREAPRSREKDLGREFLPLHLRNRRMTYLMLRGVCACQTRLMRCSRMRFLLSRRSRMYSRRMPPWPCVRHPSAVLRMTRPGRSASLPTSFYPARPGRARATVSRSTSEPGLCDVN